MSKTRKRDPGVANDEEREKRRKEAKRRCFVGGGMLLGKRKGCYR